MPTSLFARDIENSKRLIFEEDFGASGNGTYETAISVRYCAEVAASDKYHRVRKGEAYG
jgi:hypothetical protein